MQFKRFTPFFLFWLLCYGALAQNAVQTRLAYNFTDKFTFSDEWQYLSTDIYLFNGSKFTRVVNELENGAGRDKKNYRKDLEYMFISAQLKNIKIFGNENVIYPLYNFNISTDKKEYTTEVSDNIEVIRIIDKLPVSDESKNIEATIQAKAITNDETGDMFNIVSSQLLNISKLTNPSGALLSLVGEFGNLLGTTSKKKEYRFSSTIRLYEGQDFDTRLHSVRMYVLVPPDAKQPTLRMARFAEYLGGGHANLDRRKIEELVNYKDYPFLIIANYKSLYKTDVLSGNEINTELIEKRKQKITNAHDAGLVKDETFKQEMFYIEYLRTFAELKQNLNHYKLNYRNNISEANSKTLFSIIQSYRNIKSLQRQREKEFAKNSTFQTIFKPEYQAVAASADLYLEGDHNLKNSKELVLTLLELDTEIKNNLNAAKREAYLAKLNAVELPNKEYLATTIEGEAINRYITLLEDMQYKELFEKDVNKLATLAGTDENLAFRNSLMERAGATKCVRCREQVREAVLSFNKRYEASKTQEARKKTEELRKLADAKVTEFLKKKYCIDNNIKSSFPAEAVPAFVARFSEKNNDLGKQTEELNAFLKEGFKGEKLENITDYNNRLEVLMKQIEDGFNEICTSEKNLCGCYSG
ncbi:hypothetical protein AAE02nite_40510 [Adhaeribacter aerolatus]|uniref:Uncharacterized protein n=1 Tax=Adhaeribacter aerolatus TaxID=670289 RepID=A0A512B3M1_9BACT|nr:hypothetical protein [Adhaeribacter aerolatus]GEO06387.1 hypothetical protein AAE02nite_40510 [Adhaeribacter aerolatus]